MSCHGVYKIYNIIIYTCICVYECIDVSTYIPLTNSVILESICMSGHTKWNGEQWSSSTLDT